MGHGWEGEKVRLVPLERAKHLDNAVAWFNDPEVTAWTLIGDFPIGRLAELDFFDRMERADPWTGGTDVTLAVETLDGQHVGFSGIHRIDWRNGCGLTGTVIGRADLWRRGLATDATRVRTGYAFDVLGLRLLTSEVLDGNTASVRMLLRAGYTQVGRVPHRYFKRGAYRDALLFALERPAT